MTARQVVKKISDEERIRIDTILEKKHALENLEKISNQLSDNSLIKLDKEYKTTLEQYKQIWLELFETYALSADKDWKIYLLTNEIYTDDN